MLVLFATTAFFFSCSDDKEDNLNDQSNLHGTWDVKELKIDDQTASDEAKFGKQILDYLIGQDCSIISFTFNADLSVAAESSANYIEINVNSGGTGLDIPCPTQSDVETSTYTYDGTTLTYVDGDGTTVSLKPIISGNTMTILAAELGQENFDAEGELVFQKR